MPAKTEKQRRLEWFAGFFDGEGCVYISVTTRDGCKKIQTSLVVSVTSVDLPPIQLFADRFPGFKGKTLRVKKWLNANRRIQYEWCIRGLNAMVFCESIIPHSVNKREQLQLAIDFYKLPWRSQRNSSGGGFKIRTEEQVGIDRDYANLMKEMKR